MGLSSCCAYYECMPKTETMKTKGQQLSSTIFKTHDNGHIDRNM
jgi:hypothetical protein